MSNARSDTLRFLEDLTSCARRDVYSAFNTSAGKGYRLENAEVTREVLRRHLDGSQPIAVYPVVGDTTQVAILDVDSHRGETPWPELVAAVAPLWHDLVGRGFRPLAFRSGGGAGIHLWIFWEEPQSARAVRRLLQRLLARHGLKDGSEGVAAGSIEVYPKQDAVREGGVGNPIALPLARASVPLDRDFAAIKLVSFDPPEIADVYSPPVPDDSGANGAETRRPPAAEDVETLDEVLEGDLGEAEAALKHVPADDYQIWIRIGFVLKRSFGEEGYELWRRWSKKSEASYPGDEGCRRFWKGLRPSGSVGLGSLFRLAQEGGWNGPTAPIVREMNARFGILTHRNRTLIILKNGDRRPDDEFEWLTRQTFEDRMASEKISIEREDGTTKKTPKAKIWLEHPKASHYHRIDFDPSKPPGGNGRTWNTWTGFAVEPRPGTWDKLQDHMLRNVCRGDEELFAWLMNWMALGVQRPGEVIGTAPVMSGLPGAGKGFLANAYGRLWGQHYTTITHQSHVTGRFTSHLFAKRFIFVDEGIFGGDRKNAGVIKTRITEKHFVLEAKGVDAIKVRNRAIYMIASNEDSIVPADKADRRWQVLEVGDERREDHAYFGDIAAQLDAGGYEAMLHDLLRRDLKKGPDPRRIIKTEGLFQQIIRAQTPDVRYLHQILDEGLLPQPDAPLNGPGVTTIRALHEDMLKTQANASFVSPGNLGRFIRNVIPGTEKKVNGHYVTGWSREGPTTTHSTRYIFPPLKVCRAAFERMIGQPVPWSNDLENWPEDPI